MKYPKAIFKEGRVYCPECNKGYADHSGFRYHYRKEHFENLKDAVKKEVVVDDYGLTPKQLKKILVAKKEKAIKPFNIQIGETYKFAALTDTHLCSTEEQLDALHEFYEICRKETVEDIYNAGDMVAGQGVYSGQEYEVHTFGADNQVAYFNKNYPKVKDVKTHFIIGNHDYSYYKQIGLDVGRMISADREDMNYLGVFEANIMIKGIPLIRLVHPDGGMAYALTYRMQKYVEQISSGRKPRIIISGHQHTMASFLYRNVHVLQAGAFEGQTKLILRKGINPSIGGYIVEVKLSNDSHKSIIGFKPEFRRLRY